MGEIDSAVLCAEQQRELSLASNIAAPSAKNGTTAPAAALAALGNGLALEKLLDPDAIADDPYGDLLTLILERSRSSPAGRHDDSSSGRSNQWVRVL
jgi:hypothetical protein